MATPSVVAKVVPICNRRPSESDEAVEIVADDGRTPLRMILRQLGFEPGQEVRIEVISPVVGVDDESDPFLS